MSDQLVFTANDHHWLVRSCAYAVTVPLQCLLISAYCRYSADDIAWHDDWNRLIYASTTVGDIPNSSADVRYKAGIAGRHTPVLIARRGCAW